MKARDKKTLLLRLTPAETVLLSWAARKAEDSLQCFIVDAACVAANKVLTPAQARKALRTPDDAIVELAPKKRPGRGSPGRPAY